MVRAVDVASPAVVRIVTTVSGKVTLPLCGTLVTLPVSGAPYTLGWSGSGAFVSANGDILTAGHIAQIEAADEIDGIYHNGRAAVDIAIALNNNAACLGLNFIVTPTDVANGVVPALGIAPQFTPSAPTYYSFQSTSYSWRTDGERQQPGRACHAARGAEPEGDARSTSAPSSKTMSPCCTSRSPTRRASSLATRPPSPRRTS